MVRFGGDQRPARPGRVRRLAARASLAASAVCLTLGLAAPRGQADEEPVPAEPDAFTGSASATALGIDLITPGLVPVEGLFDFAVVDGRGTYDSSGQEARSSLVFPGNGVVMGPGLLCGTFLGPNIPPDGEPLFGPVIAQCNGYQYPLTVFADSLAPDGQTEGALALGQQTDPVSLQAVGAVAHAGADAATTESEVADLRVLGAPALGPVDSLLGLTGSTPEDAAVVTAEGMRQTTEQRIVDGALVVDSVATVSGLRFLGGLLTIGSVVSHSSITSAPGTDPVVDSGIEVAGVSVAGTPASITEDGLVLGDPSSPTGPLAQQLSSLAGAALQQSGITVELLPSEEGEIDGIPFATVGGLLVEFSTPVDGLPPLPGPSGDVDLNGAYGVRVQLGMTGARGIADAFPATEPLPITTPSAPRPAGVGSSGALPPTGSFPPPASPPTAAAPEAPSTEPEIAHVLAGVFADRVRLVYLAFTLAAVGLCLAPGLTLPSRLPARGIR